MRAYRETLSRAQAKTLGISLTTYYKHRERGMDHETAILEAQRSRSIRGRQSHARNHIDDSCTGIADLLKTWGAP